MFFIESLGNRKKISVYISSDIFDKINPVVKAGLTTGFIGSLNYEYLCFEGTHP